MRETYSKLRIDKKREKYKRKIEIVTKKVRLCMRGRMVLYREIERGLKKRKKKRFESAIEIHHL